MSKIIISASIESKNDYFDQFLTQKSLSRNHHDVLFLDQEKLGVEEAKRVREFFNIKPYSAKGKIAFVLNAQNLTTEAQNALLKTLEEPPLDAEIILGVEKSSDLLPTILSRCEIIYLGGGESKVSQKLENDITTLRIGTIEERFEFIERLEEKEEFLKELSKYFHHNLNDPKNLEYAKEILAAEKWANSNGNIRAILEYLMLKLPK